MSPVEQTFMKFVEESPELHATHCSVPSGYLHGPVGTGAWEPEQENLNALEAAIAKPFVSNFRPSCFLPASG